MAAGAPGTYDVHANGWHGTCVGRIRIVLNVQERVGVRIYARNRTATDIA